MSKDTLSDCRQKSNFKMRGWTFVYSLNTHLTMGVFICMAEDIASRLRRFRSSGRRANYPPAFAVAFRCCSNISSSFSLAECARALLVPSLFSANKKPVRRRAFCLYGGGHGTRTRGAVTPYSLSRRAP